MIRKPFFCLILLTLSAVFSFALMGCESQDFAGLQQQARDAAVTVDEMKPAAEEALVYLESVDEAELEAQIEAFPIMSPDDKQDLLERVAKYNQAMRDSKAYETARQTLGASQAALAAFANEEHTEPHQAISAAMNAAAPFAGGLAPLILAASSVVFGIGSLLSRQKARRREQAAQQVAEDTQTRASAVINAIDVAKEKGGGIVNFKDETTKLRLGDAMGPGGKQLVTEAKAKAKVAA